MNLSDSERETDRPPPVPDPSGDLDRGDLEVPDPLIGVDGFVTPPPGTIPVVGLGGSAGSYEALQKFLTKLPASTGAAYVVVVHLSPEHDSVLAKILQRFTPLPVLQVSEALKLQPDHVYVIPPAKLFAMTDGVLQAHDMPRHKGRHVTVDLFFRTLAETHGPKATAIVLSGGDGDGAIGIKRVKERGGLTIAQDPTEAEHDGMPRSAISTGMVDWILAAEDMPARLAEYWENGRNLKLPPDEGAPGATYETQPGEKDEATLKEILAYLKARSGHDFQYYKRATILRRIGRRMQVNGTAQLPEYLAYLQTHPGETGALLQDLLISVTNFFRDKDAFDAISAIIPKLFENKSAVDQIRVWVPACATGEEAYSIAMMLSEHAARLTHPPRIQIFATDLDQTAIEVAREGRYPETIVADVSEERLRRFFTEEEGCFRARRELREMILFAMHDLLRDSPFSKLDLISCRNLLIYLNRQAQAKVFDIFHFALNRGAHLFLGSSESIEGSPDLFSPLDKKQRLYSRRSVQRVGISVPSGAPTLSFAVLGGRKSAAAAASKARDVVEEALPASGLPDSKIWSELHVKLLEHISPPSMVVDLNYNLMHVSKTAGKYMQVGGGQPDLNLLTLVHPQLKTELRAALFRATKSDAAISTSGIPMDVEGRRAYVSISIKPVSALTDDFLLVVFDERDDGDVAGGSRATDSESWDADVATHLERELELLRGGWKDTVEQYEASTEELKASNEELQAMNEELRSATEELETGREELQSINEETITINQELKIKVEELGRANSDLQNLMAATKIATIFLDRDFRIKRFTPSTAGLFNFIPSDLGRSLFDLTHRLEYPTIAQDAEGVIDHLSIIEREVRNVDGRWFLVRLSPYRTTEDQIAGVVITFVDITERRESEESRLWLSAIVEASNDAIISYSMEGIILSWNQGAEQVFGHSAEEMKGKSQAILVPPDLQKEESAMLERLQRGETIPAFETTRLHKDGRTIDVSLSASVMRNEAGEIVAATAIARDVTVRKQAVEDLRKARNHLETRVEERTAELKERVTQLAHMASEVTMTEQRERKRLAHILHDELQQLLISVKMRIESLQSLSEEDRSTEIDSLSDMMEELIENSRSLAIDLSPPVLSEGLGPSLQWLGKTWMKEKYNLTVHTDINPGLDTRREDMRSLVFSSVRELLFNVVKHSEVKEAFVKLSAADPENLRVTVRDHGLGFDEKEVANGTAGTGLGLAGLKERLRMLGGNLRLRTNPGEGVEAILEAPARTLNIPSSTLEGEP